LFLGQAGNTVIPTFYFWPNTEFVGFHGWAVGIQDSIGFVSRRFQFPGVTFTPPFASYGQNPIWDFNDTLPQQGFKVSRIDLSRYIGQYGNIVGGYRSCWKKLGTNGVIMNFTLKN
jgi:hypothetical protein